jgi:hypothetical protein
MIGPGCADILRMAQKNMAADRKPADFSRVIRIIPADLLQPGFSGA